MIHCDTHVHIYPGYDLGALLDAAAANLGATSGHTAALILTERASHAWYAEHLRRDETAAGRWRIAPHESGEALTAHAADSARIWIFPGRQINTLERIEVLSLLTDARIEDGLPLRTTIDRVRETGGACVLPWSPGKWSGARGSLVSALFASETHGLFAGDIAMRAPLCGTPEVFAREGLRILHGSDPLPPSPEAREVGCYHSILDATLEETAPAPSLLRALREAPLRPGGSRNRVGKAVFRYVRQRTQGLFA